MVTASSASISFMPSSGLSNFMLKVEMSLCTLMGAFFRSPSPGPAFFTSRTGTVATPRSELSALSQELISFGSLMPPCW